LGPPFTAGAPAGRFAAYVLAPSRDVALLRLGRALRARTRYGSACTPSLQGWSQTCGALYFALLLLLSPEVQEKTLDLIYAKFAAVKSVSADFTETKKSRAFTKEQVQKGKFFSSRDGRLTWEVLEPVRSIFTVSGSTAKVVYPDLKYEKTYDLKTDSSLGQVVKNIFSIVSASGVGTMKKIYECGVEGSWKKGWKVTLVPHNKKVKKIIAKIILTITEKEFITAIEIFEGGGDGTTIVFTNIKLNSSGK
jgi:outer membrane lipoprotein-sorting protein